jgi:uncharacterized membrane protein
LETRPKIKISLSAADKTIAFIAWCALVAIWLLPALAYHTLPDNILTHLNGAGKVTDTGSKLTVFITPAIGTFVFLLLHVVAMYPHALNYPVTITEANAAKQYTLATKTLRILKLCIALLFIGINCEMMFPAINELIGAWTLPISTAIIFAPLTFLIVKSYRNK